MTDRPELLLPIVLFCGVLLFGAVAIIARISDLKRDRNRLQSLLSEARDDQERMREMNNRISAERSRWKARALALQEEKLNDWKAS